jgi:secreted PhoX family phosphatase
MKKNTLALAILGAIAAGLAGCNSSNDTTAAASPAPVAATATSVTFSATPTPSTDTEYLTTYTTSIARVKYSDGTTKAFPLTYNSLFKNTDQIATVNGTKQAAGQLYDMNMKPIMDPNGDPVINETADANSLLKVGNKIFLVTQWEYDNILADGQSSYKVANWYSRMPMEMSLSSINQGTDGKLSVTSQQPVDFASVQGGWIFCAGGPTPWNTHLGGEEDYDLYFVPGEKKYTTTAAGLKALSEVYFDGTKTANPYQYGFPVEVAVKEDGSYGVTKHYEMGRGTWELARFAADGRTAIYGDDGAYSGLFMFVGDVANNPKAGGSVYAAKWTQTSPDGADGASANITWVKLGHGTFDEIKAMVDKGTTINDIFDFSFAPVAGYIATRAGSAQTIWLKLKPGMEQAAAFLETRRYAAYLGATTEFTKGEGVAFNEKDKKMYYAVSYIQTSMLANDGGPVDDIRVAGNDAGATYTFDLASGQKDTQGAAINSAYVATKAYVEPLLLGKPIKADKDGNTADVNFIANTDNLFYSEAMRTLFVGEDSGNHVNNYVWAYNVDSKTLTRVLSTAAGAEATGLQIVDNLNGYAYIMSNTQHQGDWIKAQNADLTTRLKAAAAAKFGVNKYGTLNYYLQDDVGYIGGLPAISAASK